MTKNFQFDITVKLIETDDDGNTINKPIGGAGIIGVDDLKVLPPETINTIVSSLMQACFDKYEKDGNEENDG